MPTTLAPPHAAVRQVSDLAFAQQADGDPKHRGAGRNTVPCCVLVKELDVRGGQVQADPHGSS
ncbi:hypothetical protein [Streptomyces sp. AP-93]|uniref:hypothetical protein n=1 Tax=Streptomyces sp. AP-93 TaxID=2929048 RepID=UPI001FAEE6B1|nr:hypothetical protein [Streptomyces sp. AP-93]MCJ0870832.1 hypothetical protein [Streptomyces sp. AP-93]